MVTVTTSRNYPSDEYKAIVENLTSDPRTAEALLSMPEGLPLVECVEGGPEGTVDVRFAVAANLVFDLITVQNGGKIEDRPLGAVPDALLALARETGALTPDGCRAPTVADAVVDKILHDAGL